MYNASAINVDKKTCLNPIGGPAKTIPDAKNQTHPLGT
jgi:hypothetical protein